MKEHYFLEAKYIIEDGKKKYGKFHLSSNINSDIETYSKEESKIIRKSAKDNGLIKDNKYKNEIYIDNQDFVESVKKAFHKKNKKNIKRISIKPIIITASLLATIGGFYIHSNKNNTNANTVSIENEIINEEYDIEELKETENNKEITEENTNIMLDEPTLDNLSSTMVFEEEPKYDDIFKFNYEDRSKSKNVDTMLTNYENCIEKWGSTYGVDLNLFRDIGCQENPNDEKNYNNIAGHGIFQVENIWDGAEVYAYNFKTGMTESSGPIDVIRCTDDYDYCTKISAMIISSYYNTIHNNYHEKLSPAEEIGATIFAYNKGITAIMNALNNTNNYEEFIEYVKHNSIGGDNEYIEHVLSYSTDETIVTMKLNDGTENNILIDNTNIENKEEFKEPEKKPIVL